MNGIRRWLHPVALYGLIVLAIDIIFIVYTDKYVLETLPVFLTIVARVGSLVAGFVALVGMALTVGDEIAEKRYLAAAVTGTVVLALLMAPVVFVPPGPDNAPIGWCGLLIYVLPVVGVVGTARAIVKRRALRPRTYPLD